MIFKGFVIQGGSRRTILLISFGMKFDITFRKVLVNGRTCQLCFWLVAEAKGHTPPKLMCVSSVLMQFFFQKVGRRDVQIYLKY